MISDLTQLFYNFFHGPVLYDVICVIVGYLCGSMNFAIIISKLTGKGDIRQYGSGNAGTSNITRTMGWQYGLITVLGDVLKGTLAVYIGFAIVPDMGGLLAGFAAFIGHRHPLFFGLKGGKSVATFGGVALGLDIRIALSFLGAWLVIVLVTRYMAMGGILGCWVIPYTASIFRPDIEILPRVLVIMCWLLCWYHRDNIKRIRRRQEPKASLKLHEKEEKYG